LHYRATREVFDAAEALCGSACPQEWQLGADILGQLGIPERLFPEESLHLLAEMSRSETDLDVLDSVCIALGHLHHPGAAEPLLRWKRHPEGRIRLSVAIALGGIQAPEAIEGLIELSTDPRPVVRDWATFGLGSQNDLDTPRIREALCARLNDPDAVTQAEAMVGLARRKDERVLLPLLEALRPERLDEYEPRSDLVLEAAEELADPRLLPALLAMRGHPDGERVEEIIRRCQGVTDA
jgi:HEAT repeat protein